MRRGSLAAALLMVLACGEAAASGPRWHSTNPDYDWGHHASLYRPMIWYTMQPMYYTDPGDLSAFVNHASADAMVAAAAGVWNVPTSFLVPTYGGMLTEHVSGANAYLGADGPVLPADVQSSNYGAKQIAVIYDNDGSVTELLLGSGASDPSECALNGVTGSVDLMNDRNILHAVLVLNGRCTGSAPEKQLQMKYELVRAFGRIFGLAWSQNNDNVYTGSPSPTHNQALNWPIMHPIDINCGPYSYQCILQPFTLRADDISSISSLYGSGANGAPAGKVPYLMNASEVSGTITFPTGQGMEGVNVVARRMELGWPVPEAWSTVSGVSGFQFPQATSNPVTGGGLPGAVTLGWADLPVEGYYDLAMVPLLDGQDHDIVLVTTEAINPLYTGDYAIGPNGASVIAPSGAAMTERGSDWASGLSILEIPFAVTDAASTCGTGTDGTEVAPAGVSASGWWSGVLCGYGHAAWSGMTMAGGRSLTVEVTALDESGSGTTAKAVPMIGMWDATAPTGGLTIDTGIAATFYPFNSMSVGMTNLGFSTDQPLGLRMVIADQRGDGRPDFAYKARVLYADAITPSNVSASGATVTITGMGFREGNAVLVNGFPASVMSWSATSIVALVPAMSAVYTSATEPVDVMVQDLATGGTTIMTAALLYGKPVISNVMQSVSAPSGSVYLGDVAATLFSVKVLSGDGVSPMVGQSVTFTSVPGVVFGRCGAGTCVVLTDSVGIASTTVMPQVAGSVTLKAVDGAMVGTASFTGVANTFAVRALQSAAYLAETATVNWSTGVTAAKNDSVISGQTVAWTASGLGVGGKAAVQLGSAQTVTDGTGLAKVAVILGPMTGGQKATIGGCAWGTVCATVQVFGVAGADLRPMTAAGAGQTLRAGDTPGQVTLGVTDLAGNAVMGATVQVFQTVRVWQMECPARGRCPVAPVIASSQAFAVSDGTGQVGVTPLQVGGMAGTTNIAAGVGSQGFTTLSVMKSP